MTDPVQLVFACVAILEPLIHLGSTVHATTKRASFFGRDAEQFRVMYNHERHRLEALRKVLLEKEFGPEQRMTLFERFEEDWQADLFDELRQLRFLYVEIESIEVRYGMFSIPSRQPAGAPTDSVLDLSLEDRREIDLQRSATRKQLAFWALRDSKRTESLLSRLKQWVDRFQESVTMYLWAYFNERDQLKRLENDSDAQALGLANAATLRTIILDAVQDGSKLAIKPSHITHRKRIGRLIGRLDEAQFEQKSCIIEYKDYDPSADQETSKRTLDRVCQLAALLHQQTSRQLHVLRCQGYFVDGAHARYAFVFQIPDDVEAPPLSLLEIITDKDKFKSTVKHRLQLAFVLATALHRLHAVGWVHKSLRSENILIFPRRVSNGPERSDTIIQRNTEFEYCDPWVSGFEYSRVVSGDSDLREDDGIERNIYRHPERWNKPTHTFSKIHDIYALGTILLEIGLWKPLRKLSETGFSRAADADDSAAGQAIKEAVRVRILQHAEKLPYSLGRAFRDAVVVCLNGGTEDGFGSETSDDQQLQRLFRTMVVEPLGRAFLNI